MGKKLKENILEFRAVNERIAFLRIEAKPLNSSVLSIYAPTKTAEHEEKEIFYDKLEEEIMKVHKEDTVVTLGDFNAQNHIKNVAGKHTIHDNTNNNGQRLCNFAAYAGMVISNTKHQHKKCHKITRRSPDQKTHS